MLEIYSLVTCFISKVLDWRLAFYQCARMNFNEFHYKLNPLSSMLSNLIFYQKIKQRKDAFWSILRSHNLLEFRKFLFVAKILFSIFKWDVRFLSWSRWRVSRLCCRCSPVLVQENKIRLPLNGSPVCLCEYGVFIRALPWQLQLYGTMHRCIGLKSKQFAVSTYTYRVIQ